MNRLLLLFFILLYSNKLLANSSVARIFEAAGQYVAASQVIYHFKNSECGYMVQGSQSNLGVIEEIEIKLTANERIELVKYFTGIEWQIKNQNLYFMVRQSLDVKNFPNMSAKERCQSANELFLQILRQSKDNWEFTIKNIKRQ